MSDARDELAAMRSDLLRFARLQLRDAATAEDVVHETIVAALSGGGSFDRRSSYKTWVFAILRNKVVDAIRARARELPLVEVFGEDEEIGELSDDLFKPGGHWQRSAAPTDWRDPQRSFEDARFWAVFELCLDALPARNARVFMMRELLGLETDEICKELGISASNCWVVLHRARLALRACLEQRWFAGA